MGESDHRNSSDYLCEIDHPLKTHPACQFLVQLQACMCECVKGEQNISYDCLLN